MMPVSPVNNAQRRRMTARAIEAGMQRRKAIINTKGLRVGMVVWLRPSPKVLKPTRGTIAEITSDWQVRLENHNAFSPPSQITPIEDQPGQGP